MTINAVEISPKSTGVSSRARTSDITGDNARETTSVNADHLKDLIAFCSTFIVSAD
jgi:hypothetical protein